MLPINKTFTIIGSGNIAWFISQRLVHNGWQCNGVYSRNAASAKALSTTINAPIINSLPTINDDIALCCIIAVPDQAISSVASSLVLQKTTVVHTAGSVSLDLLPFSNKGVLWPIYSITQQEDITTHKDIPIIVEAANTAAEQTIKAMAEAISNQVVLTTWAQRQWLHLSAVIGNNFTNHLVAICMQICKEQQLDFSLLQPILKQTFDRFINSNPLQTQTGPAKRGDTSTMEKHFLLLQQHPLWQEVYKNISTSIEDMYNTKEE